MYTVTLYYHDFATDIRGEESSKVETWSEVISIISQLEIGTYNQITIYNCAMRQIGHIDIPQC